LAGRAAAVQPGAHDRRIHKTKYTQIHTNRDRMGLPEPEDEDCGNALRISEAEILPLSVAMAPLGS
jgi:hypothetical protein